MYVVHRRQAEMRSIRCISTSVRRTEKNL